MLMTCVDTAPPVSASPAERPDAFPPSAYQELRRMARRHLLRERKGHTLSATGLVHETWLKLASGGGQKFVNRAHFFGAASEAMRRILVDHARGRSACKRHAERVSLTAAGELADTLPAFHDVFAVYSALQELAMLNERVVRVVECRYFAGLTIPETADALGISHSTVSEEWRFARAWLQRALSTVSR